MSALWFLGERLNAIKYLGVDISSAVDVARAEFLRQGRSGEFIQADLMAVPFNEPVFDAIFSEGVLHHTDSTEATFLHLCTLLRSGGYFLFYVYKKKGPIREFTDDYIRDILAPMSDEQAWEALRPLTKLGQALGDLNIELDIPEDVDMLGIKAGRINLQRFFYWHFCKAYYRPDFEFETLNHINFDWYRPTNCHRHTEDEIRAWCQKAGLEIEHLDDQESGFTVVARKLS